MDSWLRQGPGIDELVSERKDCRRRKAETAVVITALQSNEMLNNQLQRLSEQSLQDFDIIAVYGKEDEFLGETPASILHIKEKKETGSSGAFYLGEKIALEEGYQKVILADSDCMPASGDLIEKLVNAVENGADVAMPHALYIPSARAYPGDVIHHYGCIRRNVLEKAGLTFLPLYFGGEDYELTKRISSLGFKTEWVEATVTHPNVRHILIENGNRRYYTVRGELGAYLASGSYYSALSFTWIYLMTGIALMLIGRWNHGWARFCGAWDASDMKLFKTRSRTKAATVPSKEKNKHEMVLDEDREEIEPPSPKFEKRLKKIAATLAIFTDMKLLGRNIVLVNRRAAMCIPQILMARSAYVRREGKDYEIFKNRGKTRIVASLLVLLAAAPAMLAVSAILVAKGAIFKKIKRVKSQGYGNNLERAGVHNL